MCTAETATMFDNTLVSVRLNGLYRTVQHIIVALALVVYMPVCSIYQETTTDIVAGSRCTKLENPEHGEFKCSQDPDGELCVLVCSKWFVVPITEYNNDLQHIPLENRGVYRCKKTPGGLMWMPNLFFDCIAKVDAPNFLYYFSIRLTPFPKPCANDSNPEFELARLQSVNKETVLSAACIKGGIRCSWTFDMICVNGVWEMDLWFRWQLFFSYLNDYDYMGNQMKQWLEGDIDKYFVLSRQREKTIINSRGFLIECPKGSRLERDFTCRGCSKGYYLSQDILECMPCPGNHYQDQSFAYTCKQCPEGSSSSKEQRGLQDIISCFHFSRWEQDTSITTLLTCLASIVLLCTLLLAYRSQVINEPDGIHEEVYLEPEIAPTGGGRLQRLMRTLYPPSGMTTQFDSMRASPDEFETLYLSEDGRKKDRRSSHPYSNAYIGDYDDTLSASALRSDMTIY